VTDCASCVVRNRAICASLNPEELLLLGKMGRKQRVKAGQTLLWEGDDAPVVANVLEGVLKLVVATADGREKSAFSTATPSTNLRAIIPTCNRSSCAARSTSLTGRGTG
jgi:CRP-like cAMP-binding protein